MITPPFTHVGSVNDFHNARLVPYRDGIGLENSNGESTPIPLTMFPVVNRHSHGGVIGCSFHLGYEVRDREMGMSFHPGPRPIMEHLEDSVPAIVTGSVDALKLVMDLGVMTGVGIFTHNPVTTRVLVTSDGKMVNPRILPPNWEKMLFPVPRPPNTVWVDCNGLAVYGGEVTTLGSIIKTNCPSYSLRDHYVRGNRSYWEFGRQGYELQDGKFHPVECPPPDAEVLIRDLYLSVKTPFGEEIISVR